MDIEAVHINTDQVFKKSINGKDLPNYLIEKRFTIENAEEFYDLLVLS